jgi:hypothetical protein
MAASKSATKGRRAKIQLLNFANVKAVPRRKTNPENIFALEQGLILPFSQ